MAELMDDPSLIQIGTEGRFRGLHFAVIGRIQLKYDAGLWNEWHILFDDRAQRLAVGSRRRVCRQFAGAGRCALPAFETLASQKCR
jgi:hypothetical protein